MKNRSAESHLRLCFQVSSIRSLLTVGDDKPYQGLWMTNYGHGIELLLFIQRRASLLEAIKVTGDICVPRGEYTFIVPNISTDSRKCHEPEFSGARAYRAFVQASSPCFQQPWWDDAERSFLYLRPVLTVVIIISDQKMAIHSPQVQMPPLYIKRINLEEIFH
jgi:hypothetical protein